MFALVHVGRARRRAPQPQEIAPGVYCMEVGTGIMRSNVYFVRSSSSWALIDTASAKCGRVIQEAAESLFGANTPPAAILLTHSYPDHAGSRLELARRWGCLVYVHPDEMPLAGADEADLDSYLSTVKEYANPLDRWVILLLLRVLPPRAFDPSAGVPGLPDWECIPTPGHVAFFRNCDRVLIAGDAVLTVQLNSWWGFLLWGSAASRKT
jgi:glyoxylase-like metal-dependent hydrolase (beta-lactamase superfamily II)